MPLGPEKDYGIPTVITENDAAFDDTVPEGPDPRRRPLKEAYRSA
ncbi:hypothetical protein [Streptomyces atratus]